MVKKGTLIGLGVAAVGALAAGTYLLTREAAAYEPTLPGEPTTIPFAPKPEPGRPKPKPKVPTDPYGSFNYRGIEVTGFHSGTKPHPLWREGMAYWYSYRDPRLKNWIPVFGPTQSISYSALKTAIDVGIKNQWIPQSRDISNFGQAIFVQKYRGALIYKRKPGVPASGLYKSSTYATLLPPPSTTWRYTKSLQSAKSDVRRFLSPETPKNIGRPFVRNGISIFEWSPPKKAKNPKFKAWYTFVDPATGYPVGGYKTTKAASLTEVRRLIDAL